MSFESNRTFVARAYPIVQGFMTYPEMGRKDVGEMVRDALQDGLSQDEFSVIAREWQDKHYAEQNRLADSGHCRCPKCGGSELMWANGDALVHCMNEKKFGRSRSRCNWDGTLEA